MPPLTLEQVLARAMRLPKQRARHHVEGLFSGGVASNSSPHPGAYTPGTAVKANRVMKGNFVSDRRLQHDNSTDFFAMIDREDAARTAGRPSIIRSSGPASYQNSNDLLSVLATTAQTNMWEEGLASFLRCTGMQIGARSAAADADADTTTLALSPLPRTATAASPAQSAAVSVGNEHLTLVIDMCACAGQWEVVEALAQYYGASFPEAYTHAVASLVRGYPGTAAAAAACDPPLKGWQRAMRMITRGSLPAAQVPVQAYNACLDGCEHAAEWRGALRVVRAMGPNPIKECAAKQLELDSEDDSSDAAWLPRGPSASEPPSPDVVTYATLIATLEQAGKDNIALFVLNALPPLEKEAITASYAALIHVWASQVSRRRGRHF